jgi:hypothetical protein
MRLALVVVAAVFFGALPSAVAAPQWAGTWKFAKRGFSYTLVVKPDRSFSYSAKASYYCATPSDDESTGYGDSLLPEEYRYSFSISGKVTGGGAKKKIAPAATEAHGKTKGGRAYTVKPAISGNFRGGSKRSLDQWSMGFVEEGQCEGVDATAPQRNRTAAYRNGKAPRR